MLDNHQQIKRELPQDSSTSISQGAPDFDSILQELKSVGEAHQPDPPTMIIENITANIKQEGHINDLG